MIRLFEKTETEVSVSSSTEIELDMETGGFGYAIEIVRVMAKHNSGSATSYQISIGNAPAATVGSIEMKYLSGSTAVATTLDESDVGAYCTTTSNGKLYLRFNPNSGSNNSFSYSIMYKR
jgi:hypothetical protein